MIARRHPAFIASAQQRMNHDVVGLERRVGFQLAAPIALGLLLREQKIPRGVNCLLDFVQTGIESPNRTAAPCLA